MGLPLDLGVGGIGLHDGCVELICFGDAVPEEFRNDRSWVAGEWFRRRLPRLSAVASHAVPAESQVDRHGATSRDDHGIMSGGFGACLGRIHCCGLVSDHEAMKGVLGEGRSVRRSEELFVIRVVFREKPPWGGSIAGGRRVKLVQAEVIHEVGFESPVVDFHDPVREAQAGSGGTVLP